MQPGPDGFYCAESRKGLWEFELKLYEHARAKPALITVI